MADFERGTEYTGVDYVGNETSMAENEAATEKITENTTGTVVAVEAHKTKKDVFIILGSEDSLKPRLDRFFTREASGVTGDQFWGHYCMTLGEAFTDFEERVGRVKVDKSLVFCFECPSSFPSSEALKAHRLDRH